MSLSWNWARVQIRFRVNREAKQINKQTKKKTKKQKKKRPVESFVITISEL